MTMTSVISGKQLKDAQARANWSNRELARAFDVSLSTLNNWFNQGVVGRREEMVRDRLGLYLRGDDGSGDVRSLKPFSDVELLAELWQRMDAYKRGQASAADHTPTEVSGEQRSEPSRDADSVRRPSNTRGPIRGRSGMPPSDE
jgi:hypothetical protein